MPEGAPKGVQLLPPSVLNCQAPCVLSTAVTAKPLIGLPWIGDLAAAQARNHVGDERAGVCSVADILQDAVQGRMDARVQDGSRVGREGHEAERFVERRRGNGSDRSGGRRVIAAGIVVRVERTAAGARGSARGAVERHDRRSAGIGGRGVDNARQTTDARGGHRAIADPGARDQGVFGDLSDARAAGVVGHIQRIGRRACAVQMCEKESLGVTGGRQAGQVHGRQRTRRGKPAADGSDQAARFIRFVELSVVDQELLEAGIVETAGDRGADAGAQGDILDPARCAGNPERGAVYAHGTAHVVVGSSGEGRNVGRRVDIAIDVDTADSALNVGLGDRRA